MRGLEMRCRRVQISNLTNSQLKVKLSMHQFCISITWWAQICWLQTLFGDFYWSIISSTLDFKCPNETFIANMILHTAFYILHNNGPLDLCSLAEMKSHRGQTGKSRKNDYSNQPMYTFCRFSVCWLSTVVPLLPSWMTEDIKFSIRNPALVISQWARAAN